MPLLTTDIDKVQFPIADHGYAQAAVEEFVATVRISLAEAEADLADARAQTATAGEAAPGDTGNTVTIAARLLEFAQTAVDEQRAAADTEADRVVTDAHATANTLIADAHDQAAAAKADTEQTSARLVQTARDAEAEIQAHVTQLQHTHDNSRNDLRQLAQQLTAIADTDDVPD